MSIDNKGLSCARCKAYLFDEDDVVYCPVCGAPHHRECYNALGKCALEELHGTEQEYSKEKEREALQKASETAEQQKEFKDAESENIPGYTTCGMCGEKYPSDYRSCKKCGAPNVANMNGFIGFDFLGGIPKDYKIDENVTADEAKRFVVANTHRYIPKFATLNKTKKTSWNWLAFLFPGGWMLSRKMFKSGIITCFLSVLSTLLTYPLNLTLYQLGVSSSTNSAEFISSLYEAMPQISVWILILGMLGFLSDIIIRIVSAMFGDYMYKKYTVAQITEIKKGSDDIDASFRKKGGVSIINFLVATLIVQYLPVIITAFM